MRKAIILLALLFFSNLSFGQTENWMTSLDIAKRLSRSQNKPILMVWEEATLYPLPVYIKLENGRGTVVDDLFSSVELNRVIWEYFVPVKINELLYEDLYNEIKGKRKQNYIDKFNDDSMKVMDANGNIIGASGAFTGLLNFTNFVAKYALKTTFLENELLNYHNKKDFYTAFYLGSKYIDYSIFMDKNVRPEILNLSSIYLDEANNLLINDNALEDKEPLLERLRLTELKQELIKNNPRRVLRQLKKIDTDQIEGANKSLLSFLYYTAYRLIGDKEEFTKLESEISLLNLKQAQYIVNLNQ